VCVCVCIHKLLLSFLSPYQRKLSRRGYAITSREYRRRRKACRYRAHFRYLCAIIQRGVINSLSRGDVNDILFRRSIQAGNKTDMYDERASLHSAGTYQAGCRFLRYLNYFRCFRCYFRCYRAEISKQPDFNFFDAREAAQSICTCIIFRADCNSLPKAARYILLSISFSNISFF